MTDRSARLIVAGLTFAIVPSRLRDA